MPEPNEAAYEEAARASWERAKALWPQGPDRYVELMLMRPDFRALVDTVWALARRQAAADIRAQIAAEAVPPVALRSGAVLRANSVADWAARIAEGTVNV